MKVFSSAWDSTRAANSDDEYLVSAGTYVTLKIKHRGIRNVKHITWPRPAQQKCLIKIWFPHRKKNKSKRYLRWLSPHENGNIRSLDAADQQSQSQQKQRGLHVCDHLLPSRDTIRFVVASLATDATLSCSVHCWNGSNTTMKFQSLVRFSWSRD